MYSPIVLELIIMWTCLVVTKTLLGKCLMMRCSKPFNRFPKWGFKVTEPKNTINYLRFSTCKFDISKYVIFEVISRCICNNATIILSIFFQSASSLRKLRRCPGYCVCVSFQTWHSAVQRSLLLSAASHCVLSVACRSTSSTGQLSWRVSVHNVPEEHFTWKYWPLQGPFFSWCV